jgi:ElaB/YqjD/DUF883 family membrane-anchored ribosome-binding protein|nr:MAG: hypothetical protein DIU60_20335 [Actinomycetota bacterium]
MPPVSDAPAEPDSTRPDDQAQDQDQAQAADTQPEPDKGDDTADDKGGKDGKGDDDAASLKSIARRWETRAKQNKAELDKLRAEHTALIDQIAKALGLKADADDDPAKVAEKLTSELASTRDELRQARVELAVHRAAARHGGDPDALLDSRSFLKAVADLDPDDDGFDKAVSEAIADAIKANPRLAAKPAPEPDPGKKAPSRSGGDMTGAPDRGRQRPTGLAAAIRSYYGR